MLWLETGQSSESHQAVPSRLSVNSARSAASSIREGAYNLLQRTVTPLQHKATPALVRHSIDKECQPLPSISTKESLG